MCVASPSSARIRSKADPASTTKNSPLRISANQGGAGAADVVVMEHAVAMVVVSPMIVIGANDRGRGMTVVVHGAQSRGIDT